MRAKLLHVRTGFSLTQLVVLLAMPGLFFAVLLPAVQKMREARNEARNRIRCNNNLMRIGLALHNGGGGRGNLMGWAEYGGLDTCRSTTAVHGWIANPSRDRNDIADG